MRKRGSSSLPGARAGSQQPEAGNVPLRIYWLCLHCILLRCGKRKKSKSRRCISKYEPQNPAMHCYQPIVPSMSRFQSYIHSLVCCCEGVCLGALNAHGSYSGSFFSHFPSCPGSCPHTHPQTCAHKASVVSFSPLSAPSLS